MADRVDFEEEPSESEEISLDEDEEQSSDDSESHKVTIKGAKKQKDGNTRRQVLAFTDSEDESDDGGAFMEDSDIEGAEDNDSDLPDEKDWGSKTRNYYNTDFVDPDYSTYNEKEAELAKEEEEEAKKIQLRLAKEMTEKDFLLGDVMIKARKTAASMTDDAEEVKADFSTLTQRQRREYFLKDSPEFPGLISDFQKNMEEADSLLAPVLQYVKQNNVPMIPAFEFAEVYHNLVLTYCSNIVFYTLLKTNSTTTQNHPVIQRLVQLKKLLKELAEKYENIIRPQLEALLERIVDGDKFEVLPIETRSAKEKKNKLGVLDEYDEQAEDAEATLENMEDTELEVDDELDEEGAAVDDNRRGITYQIAKNKGLTPNRKKELRNPRVKHRTKFRKALIRRKGAVRTVRKEIKRYDGEISGIKSTVVKSVKFKS